MNFNTQNPCPERYFKKLDTFLVSAASNKKYSRFLKSTDTK